MRAFTAADNPPPSGWVDRAVRRAPAAAHVVVGLLMYGSAILALGLAAAPSLAVGAAAWPRVATLNAPWRWIVAGPGIAALLFLWGFALLAVVPAMNAVLPTRIRPSSGGYFTVRSIPWYLHNGLLYLVRFTFLPFVTMTPIGTHFLRAMGMRIRGYLSTAFGCPFDGPVAPERVRAVAERLLDMGVYEVAISDTIGVAQPGQVLHVLDTVLGRMPVDRVALHFHDTRGTALANVLAGLTCGVRTFDASAGGLGGCPYAPGASGNLATEDLLYVLDGLGIHTGVSIDQVLAASALIGTRLDHPLPSRYAHASAATAERRQEQEGRERASGADGR